MLNKYCITVGIFMYLVSIPSSTWGNNTLQANEARIQYIHKLIYESSGAKQVINSGSPSAITQRNEAIALYNKADDLIKAGSFQEASPLLEQASRLMFAAIRSATPEKLTNDKNTRDYHAKKESISSLKSAFERIAEEIGDRQAVKKLDQQLDLLMTKGDEALSAGNLADARIEIDKAYHLLKVSIESMRGGQTLVRSLNFESPEEEYRYELDRNETHRMLIGLLINEKNKSEYIRKQLLKYIDEATRFRQQAEVQAQQGEYRNAIELLEKSTLQLVRAIRSAGIYIPG